MGNRGTVSVAQSNGHPFLCGVIEGFFGAPWSHETRLELVPEWATLGLTSYVYAPKADRNLREGWRSQHTAAQQSQFIALSRVCRENGLSFGMGLSPYELYKEPLDAAEVLLLQRVEGLLALGLDTISILFDDMRGDVEGLAAAQARLVNAVHREFSPAIKVAMCPSYYTTDPVLDRVFGDRPVGYVEDLGRLLHSEVAVYWTGSKVCSPHYSASHLEEVSILLRRKPLIWDNYPVNDGPKMCKHLHLAPFSARTELPVGAAGVMINPMNQGWLSLLPISSLNGALRGQGEAHWKSLFPSQLQDLLARDMARFGTGLDNIPMSAVESLLVDYGKHRHPAAGEVISWLRGETIVGPECLTNE